MTTNRRDEVAKEECARFEAAIKESYKHPEIPIDERLNSLIESLKESKVPHMKLVAHMIHPTYPVLAKIMRDAAGTNTLRDCIYALAAYIDYMLGQLSVCIGGSELKDAVEFMTIDDLRDTYANRMNEPEIIRQMLSLCTLASKTKM